jgi:hypothetical protein
MLGIPRDQAFHEFPSSYQDEPDAGRRSETRQVCDVSDRCDKPDVREADAEADADAGPVALTVFQADAGARPQALAAIKSRAVARFDEIQLSGTTMTPGNFEVMKAILAVAVSIGTAAALGFGLGRGIGGAVAELGVRRFFDSWQPLGIGEDRNYIDRDTNDGLLQIATVATGRWIGASLCGGIGAAVGSVVAPRVAALSGRQLAAIPPAQLVPDHVADLLDETGSPYGADGVYRLRLAIKAAQDDCGQIGGTVHVRGGVVAFGALNAARGASLGMSAVGVLPDIGISAGVSLTAGSATGLVAATHMVTKRHRLPDAGYTGDDPTPLVQVPLFEVKKTAPILPRFTGTGVRDSLENMGRGAADRIRLFLGSTWLLGLLGLLVNFAGAATRPAPLNWIHRTGKALELGVGVGVAVGPYFRGIPPINARDRVRLERQQVRMETRRETLCQTPREPSADAASSVETLALRQLQ